MGVLAYSSGCDRLTNLALYELNNIGRRAKAIGGGSIGEQAWAMLLDLYLAEQKNVKVQTIYLVEQSGMPRATGLRYVSYLADLHLITRSTDESDKRSKFVELTKRGRSMLEDYLAEALAELDRRLPG